VPARQRGWARKRKHGWQACWREGTKQNVGPQLFPSKTAALDWLDDTLQAGRARRGRDITFAEHVDRYLRVHAAVVDPSTIRTLQDRLGVVPDERADHKRGGRSYSTAVEQFGDIVLTDLELMSSAIAEWQTTLPPAYRYAILRALRQVLSAAVRWDLIRANPAARAGPNPQPRREEVAFFQSLADVDKLADELGHAGEVNHRTVVVYGPIAVFGVETGMRPSEWLALESCSYVKAGLVFSVLKTTRMSSRLRQRIASRRLLPSACLRSR
jgi:hypothetical protein